MSAGPRSEVSSSRISLTPCSASSSAASRRVARHRRFRLQSGRPLLLARSAGFPFADTRLPVAAGDLPSRPRSRAGATTLVEHNSWSRPTQTNGNRRSWTAPYARQATEIGAGHAPAKHLHTRTCSRAEFLERTGSPERCHAGNPYARIVGLELPYGRLVLLLNVNCS
jgi:hypothetical protein